MQHGKISLIGFMGAGKSTVAALLGQRLKFDCYEMDTGILDLAGTLHARKCTTIAEIIDTYGETAFRDLEEQVACGLRLRYNLVVSTGGGIIGRETNMKHLKEGNGIVVFLRTRYETVAKRLQGDVTRPLFRDHSRAQKLFLERLPLYERWSDTIIDTDELTPQDVCDRISSDMISKGLS